MDFNRVDKYKDLNKSPSFNEEAHLLNMELKSLDRESLIKMMKISDKLADSTLADIHYFTNKNVEKQSALFAYSGTVFKWIKSEELNVDHLVFASNHLRILSGLYGVLRPCDRISKYRLEMKIPLSAGERKNLYSFWREKITNYLVKENQPIINLASTEYSKAVDKTRLNHPMVSIQFKEREGQRIRTVGMYSKMARGMITGKIIREKTVDPQKVKEWNIDGYLYDVDLSSETDWVFVNKRS